MTWTKPSQKKIQNTKHIWSCNKDIISHKGNGNISTTWCPLE